jgi:hypothetical protein
VQVKRGHEALKVGKAEHHPVLARPVVAVLADQQAAEHGAVDMAAGDEAHQLVPLEQLVEGQQLFLPLQQFEQPHERVVVVPCHTRAGNGGHARLVRRLQAQEVGQKMTQSAMSVLKLLKVKLT